MDEKSKQERTHFTQIPNVLYETCDLPWEPLYMFQKMVSQVGFSGGVIQTGSVRKLANLMRIKRDKAHRYLNTLIDAGLIIAGTDPNTGVPAVAIDTTDLWELNSYHAKGVKVPCWTNLQTVLEGVRKIGQSTDTDNEIEGVRKIGQSVLNSGQSVRKSGLIVRENGRSVRKPKLKRDTNNSNKIKEDKEDKNIVTGAVFSDEKNDATIADKTVFDLDELPEGTIVYDEAPAPVDQLFIISMDEITGEITNKPANTTRRTSKYMCPELPDLEQPPTKELFLQVFSHYKKSPIPTDLRNREAKLADAAAEHLLNAPNGLRKGVTGYSLAEVDSVYRLLLGLNLEEWLQDKDWIDKGLPVTPNAVKNNIDTKLKLIAARKKKYGKRYGQDTTSAPASQTPEAAPDPYKNLLTPEGKVIWTEEGPDYTGNPETGDNWRKFRMMDIDEAIGQYGWSPDEALKYHVWNHIRVHILMEQERVTA